MSKKEKFIRERQSEYPAIEKMQEWIDKGIAWSMEGSVGREAMSGLESGMYFLPNESHKDYYGNHIPSREEVRIGTAGSLDNSLKYYTDESSIELLEITQHYNDNKEFYE